VKRSGSKRDRTRHLCALTLGALNRRGRGMSGSHGALHGIGPAAEVRPGEVQSAVVGPVQCRSMPGHLSGTIDQVAAADVGTLGPVGQADLV